MSRRSLVEGWVRRLLADLAATEGGAVRVEHVGSGLVVVVMVCQAGEKLPTCRAARRTREEGREECRGHIVTVLRAAGRPMDSKEITAALVAAGHEHGKSTVAKSLADLGRAKAVTNRRDGKGYRLAEWQTPAPKLPGRW